MKKEMLLPAGIAAQTRILPANEAIETRKPAHRKTKKIFLWLLGIAIVVGILVKSLFTFKSYAEMLKEYEMRNAQVENEQSIIYTAGKYNLNLADIVTVEPSGHQKLFKEFGNSVPEALVFDKQGNHIEYKSNAKSCNAGVFGFIPALEKNGHYNITGKTTLNTEMEVLRDLQGNSLTKTYLDPTADFYILISWSACTGVLNKDHVKEWERLAAENTKAKIQVVEVNLDAQQWWPEQARDSILKRMPKFY